MGPGKTYKIQGQIVFWKVFKIFRSSNYYNCLIYNLLPKKIYPASVDEVIFPQMNIILGRTLK